VTLAAPVSVTTTSSKSVDWFPTVVLGPAES
jgi:hypothetical protein